VQKHRATFHPAKALPEEALRVFLPVRRVIGGVACSQWLMTLTGESPTPFRSPLRTTQADKSTMKRSCPCGGVLVPSLARALGDGSFSGVVPLRRDQRRTRGNSGRCVETMRAVSPTVWGRLQARSSLTRTGLPVLRNTLHGLDVKVRSSLVLGVQQKGPTCGQEDQSAFVDGKDHPGIDVDSLSERQT
jgi:hypothetical protein